MIDNKTVGIFSCYIEIAYYKTKYEHIFKNKKHIPKQYQDKINYIKKNIALFHLNKETKEHISEQNKYNSIKTILNKNKINTKELSFYIKDFKVLNYHGDINYNINKEK